MHYDDKFLNELRFRFVAVYSNAMKEILHSVKTDEIDYNLLKNEKYRAILLAEFKKRVDHGNTSDFIIQLEKTDVISKQKCENWKKDLCFMLQQKLENCQDAFTFNEFCKFIDEFMVYLQKKN